MPKPKPVAPKIDERRFVALLTARFPEVAAQITDVSAGLVHLEMAELRRATNAAIAAGDLQTVRAHFEFVDELLRAADADVENAVIVSYLEDLDFRGPHGDAARKLLRPRLRTELDAQNAYLEQLFGKPAPPQRKPRRERGPR
jgi:hypothetical protein